MDHGPTVLSAVETEQDDCPCPKEHLDFKERVDTLTRTLVVMRNPMS